MINAARLLLIASWVFAAMMATIMVVCGVLEHKIRMRIRKHIANPPKPPELPKMPFP